MTGSSDTPRGREAGGAGTAKPKRKTATSAKAPAKRKSRAKGSTGKNPGADKSFAKTGDKLLLGWRIDEDKPPVGFRDGPEPASDKETPIWLEGEGHMITIAPTGAGKGRGALIPNLLTYEGPAIVIDPKGEACRITARRRSEMGQAVHVIDPFRVISDETDSLNPLDAFDVDGVDASALAMDIARQLSGGAFISKDPFWDIRGHGLSAGVISAVASVAEPEKRNLLEVRRLLKSEDTNTNLAILLEYHADKLTRFAYEELSSFMQTVEVTRSGIHATTCGYYHVIASDAAQRTVARSTIDLNAVRRGDPMTIYLVVPPSKLASHAPLFRLWTAALMSAVLSREGNLPKHRTLFAIDECAQLGDFGLLPMVYTLARSYGMRVWTFFQDLAQIQRMLPAEWPTVLTNAAAIQVFGVPNHLMASSMSQVLGDFSEDQLRQMDRAHLALQASGARGLTAKRIDYLLDPAFKGLYDKHPMLGQRPPKDPGSPITGL